MVHTPSKLDALRQSAAERRHAANASGSVPPSVLASATNTPVGAVNEGDLLGGQVDAVHSEVVHDFDAWDGDNPPGTRHVVAADVHGSSGQDLDQEHSNVTTRRVKTHVSFDALTHAEDAGAGASAGAGAAATSTQTNDALHDADKISVGSVSDVTPPPSTGSHPPLNPFTPEWFAQLVSTAASAAATAVANSARPAAAPGASHSAPRRLNDRKVPDFWEDRPEF